MRKTQCKARPMCKTACRSPTETYMHKLESAIRRMDWICMHFTISKFKSSFFPLDLLHFKSTDNLYFVKLDKPTFSM